MNRVEMHPPGWADVVLDARLSYQRFAAVVERARREVLREMPQFAHVMVVAMSAEAVMGQRGIGEARAWGEYYLPNGPVVLYQLAFEEQPDQENYYRQIKAVVRHEFEHAAGMSHPEPGLGRIEGFHRPPPGSLVIEMPA